MSATCHNAICSQSQLQSTSLIVGDLQPADGMAAQVEQEALKEINAARTDPAAYAAHVKPMLALFEGNVLKIPGQTPLITNEGPDAVNELLTFLQGAKAVPALTRVSPGPPLSRGRRPLETTSSGRAWRTAPSMVSRAAGRTPD